MLDAENLTLRCTGAPPRVESGGVESEASRLGPEMGLASRAGGRAGGLGVGRMASGFCSTKLAPGKGLHSKALNGPNPPGQ